MSIVYVIDKENNSASFQFYANNTLVSEFFLNALTSQITLTAINNNVVLQFDEHKNNIITVMKWIKLVQENFNVDQSKPNRHRQEYIKRPNASEGDFRILDYIYEVDYDHNTKEITLLPRPAHVFDWYHFVYFMTFHYNFVQNIERDY